MGGSVTSPFPLKETSSALVALDCVSVVPWDAGSVSVSVTVVGEHERAHVQFLERKLGGNAAARPTFDFAGTTSDPDTFAGTAVEVEETAAAAYIGQGANLTRRLVSDAARICAVEARHAAWIRDFVNQHPAPRAADPARSAAEVTAELRRLGLVTES